MALKREDIKDGQLAIKESNSLQKLSKAKKNYSKIQDAVNRFEKMKKL